MTKHVQLATRLMFFLFLGMTMISCADTFSKKDAPPEGINQQEIPNDTVAFTNPELFFENGVYFYKGTPFSGTVHRVLIGYDIATYSSVLNGKLHGAFKSFYASGKPYELRTYKNGLSVGRHMAFWESTGNIKFEYHYHDQKKEGTQKGWYANGDLAKAYTYKNDQLDGLQQAWRENGSLYRNYVVKNGVPYGMQKSKACYEVSEEEVILQANKK